MLRLAAERTRQEMSAAVTFTMQATGPGPMTATGIIRMRTKPEPIMSGAFTLFAAGHRLLGGVQEIITGHSIYFKAPPLARRFGKPWVEVTAPSLPKPSAVSLAQFSPFGQALSHAGTRSLSEFPLLAQASHVRVVGQQTIAGVRATEYSGTYQVPAKELRIPGKVHGRKLPARARRAARKLMRSLATLPFDAWIDQQHQLRKITIMTAFGPERITMTMVYTAINKPVTITLPPASQVAMVPLRVLGGAAT